MGILNFLKTHKMSVLSSLLVVTAALLGADLGFAMAVDPAELADNPNPSENMNEVSQENDGGRPKDEALQTDEQGGETQLQGKAATATDRRDAGQEAEDYDPDIVNFRTFRFPIETYIANKCRPVKTKGYIRKHWRSGTTDLDAIYHGPAIAITGGSDTTVTIDGESVKVYTHSNRQLTIPTSLFDNYETLSPYGTAYVDGVDGYDKDSDGNEVVIGELALYVLDNTGEDGTVKFLVENAPTKAANTTTIEEESIFMSAATACSESQMKVAPETYLPEEHEVYLQKKNMMVVITDEFEEQDSKTGQGKKDVMANAMFNFRRKMARSHWLGRKSKTQVKVAELNNQREDVFKEEGILRQIPMLYTHDEELVDDDMLAITSLVFTENSATDHMVAFCGKREMRRVMKMVNSAIHYKDVSKVKVDKYGIRVRSWEDNFGTLDFVYDPTLDDIHYEDYMVILDLDHAVRYYKRNEKTMQQDLSKTGDAREANAYIKSVIDCVCLKGYNAVIVTTNSRALKAAKLGGVQASFVSVAALPTGEALTPAAKALKYYLTAADTTNGFEKGSIVEWDAELDDWKEFEGVVAAA